MIDLKNNPQIPTHLCPIWVQVPTRILAYIPLMTKVLKCFMHKKMSTKLRLWMNTIQDKVEGIVFNTILDEVKVYHEYMLIQGLVSIILNILSIMKGNL